MPDTGRILLLGSTTGKLWTCFDCGKAWQTLIKALAPIDVLRKGPTTRKSHIMVSAPPEMAPIEIMRWSKGRTASPLSNEFAHIKRYWGWHVWAGRYACATMGQMTEKIIRQYFEHHFEPGQNAHFRMGPD